MKQMKHYLTSSTGNSIIEAIERVIRETSSYIQSHSHQNFMDEFEFKFWSIRLPEPYSKEVDPEGERNREVSENFRIEFTIKLSKYLELDLSNNSELPEHFLITPENNDEESAEIHFNDSTLNIIYHYTGQY